ncbi:MAG: copper ion binding protein, partial [Sporomusa sp.]
MHNDASEQKCCKDACCCSSQAAIPVSEAVFSGAGSHLKNTTFQVAGLDCADCAANVEKAVRRLYGVVDAHLNFTTAKLKVAYDSTVLGLDEIVNVITGFGYSTTMLGTAKGVYAVFRLAGLDCADCAANLEKRIAALTGVQAVKVNFGASKMMVEHTITDEEIIEVVQQAGYQAVND